MSTKNRAFTLLEVVLATGVFALGVISLIGLLAAVLSPGNLGPPPGEWGEACKAIRETLHHQALRDYERQRVSYLSGQARTLYAYRLTAQNGQFHWKVSEASQLLVDLEKRATGTVAFSSGVYRFQIALSSQHHDHRPPPNSYLILQTRLEYMAPTSPDDAHRILLPDTSHWLPLPTQSLIFSR